MKGKICMVTGATSGIGEATARTLAQMGATVVVVGRSSEKSVATVEHIKQQTGNPTVEFMLADLSSQKEIRRLARRLEGTGGAVNALHPGVVATRFGHNNQGLAGMLVRLSNLFAISPERGARTIIYLATSPEVESMTGQYFVNKKKSSSSPASYDRAKAVRLWQVSETMTGLSA